MSAALLARNKKLLEGGLVAIIGDDDTVTGFLLAGIGNVDSKKDTNFLIVNNKTTQAQIEEAFKKFTTRKDIAILLINQHVANEIRHLISVYEATIPTILEIPSKDHPYDPSKDSVMDKIRQILGPAFEDNNN